MLHHIFTPLFEVTADPSINPALFIFLQTITGFDCVDDESNVEHVQATKVGNLPLPEDWTGSHNPPYEYWCYYLYANLACLNAFRSARGYSTFSFRPHCGTSQLA